MCLKESKRLEDRFLVNLIVSVSQIELCAWVLIAPIPAIYGSLKTTLLTSNHWY